MKTTENCKTAIACHAEAKRSRGCLHVPSIALYPPDLNPRLIKKLPNEPILDSAATLSIRDLQPNCIKHARKTNPFYTPIPAPPHFRGANLFQPLPGDTPWTTHPFSLVKEGWTSDFWLNQFWQNLTGQTAIPLRMYGPVWHKTN